jgi:hypothetical protein
LYYNSLLSAAIDPELAEGSPLVQFVADAANAQPARSKEKNGGFSVATKNPEMYKGLFATNLKGLFRAFLPAVRLAGSQTVRIYL